MSILPFQQQRVAVGVLEDLQVPVVEGILQQSPDLRTPDDLERHQLKDYPVRGGNLGQGPTADEQGHIARGYLLARDEREDPLFHFHQVNAVFP